MSRVFPGARENGLEYFVGFFVCSVWLVAHDTVFGSSAKQVLVLKANHLNNLILASCFFPVNSGPMTRRMSQIVETDLSMPRSVGLSLSSVWCINL